MTCNEIENRLPAYLEDLLSPEEKKGITGHLASCPRCGRAFADLKKAEELVQGLAEVEPPPFFEQRIMSRVREEAGRKQGILRRLFYPLHIKIPLQALATLLVAVLAFHVYQQGDPEMKQMAPLPRPLTESGTGRVMTVREKEIPPAGAEALGKAQDGAGRQDADKALETLPPEQKHKEKMADTGAAAGESRKTISAPSPSRMTAVADVERTVMDLTIQVRDTNVASLEIEARLGQINARIIERRQRNGSEFLQAEIAAQNVAALLDLLDAIGMVNLETSPRPVPDGYVTVSIKIVGHPGTR
jgi:anti-sigma factor RsiW